MMTHEGLPPISFGEALAQIEMPEETRQRIQELKEAKQRGLLGEGERISILDVWIASSFETAGAFCRDMWQAQMKAGLGADLPPWTEFDKLFFHTVTGTKE